MFYFPSNVDIRGEGSKEIEMNIKSIKVNALLNIIKQICTIIFPLITFPYISRILGVELYGKVNFSMSVVSYFSLIAGLGIYSYAVRNGSRIRDEKELFAKFANEVFSINILSTIVAYVLLFCIIFFWPSLEAYKVLILILSLNIFMTTLGTDWINIVYEDFLYITVRYIVCQSCAVILTLLFVNSEEDIALYALLVNFGSLTANALNIFYIRKKLGIKLHFTLMVNLKEHFRPILILFGNTISSMVYLYADSTMLGIMVGDIAVGYYTVASRIYTIIKQLLNAIAVVATPHFSHDVHNAKNDINIQFNDLIGALVLILLPAVAGIICVGKELIILLSGIEYIEAYAALVILSLSLICSTIACIYISVVMLALGKDKQILLSTTISAVVNILLNMVLIPKFSYNAAAFTTLVSEFLMMLLGVYFTKSYLRLMIKKQSIVALSGMGLVFIVCGALQNVCNSAIMYLMFSIAISVLGYGIIVLVAYREELMKMGRKQNINPEE